MGSVLTENASWVDVLLGPDAMDEALAAEIRLVLTGLTHRTEFLRGKVEALEAVIGPEAAAAALAALEIANQAQTLMQALLDAKDLATTAGQNAQTKADLAQGKIDAMNALMADVQAFLDGQQGDTSIARRNAANTFTQKQTLSNDLEVAGTAKFTGSLIIPVREE